MDNTTNTQVNGQSLDEMHPEHLFPRYSEDHHVSYAYETDHVGMICRCGWHERLRILDPTHPRYSFFIGRRTVIHFRAAERYTGVFG